MDSSIHRYSAFGMNVPFTRPSPLPASGVEVDERMHIAMTYAGLPVGGEAPAPEPEPGGDTAGGYVPMFRPRRR